jgi:hypothetical protein
MNKITIEYHCQKPPQRATWTIMAEDDADTANCKWEFEPPLQDGTKDPAGVLTKLIEAMAGLVKHG